MWRHTSESWNKGIKAVSTINVSTGCPAGTTYDASFDISTNCPAGTTHDAGVNVFNGCPAGTTHDAGFDVVQLVLPMMLGIMLQIAILWVPQMKQVLLYPLVIHMQPHLIMVQLSMIEEDTCKLNAKQKHLGCKKARPVRSSNYQTTCD